MIAPAKTQANTVSEVVIVLMRQARLGMLEEMEAGSHAVIAILAINIVGAAVVA